MPWQKKPQRESTGSGAIVSVPDVPGGRAILTNAHVVADSTFVTVRRHGSSVKYPATIRAAGHEADLALLNVADPAFWEEADVVRSAPAARGFGLMIAHVH